MASGGESEFEEHKYSAVHYPSGLVMELVQKTIAANRTTQKFILLEGLINSNKLESSEEQLELRFMDEFFSIEKNIGEVNSVISMQFKVEPTQIKEEEMEEFKQEEEKEEAKQDGEDKNSQNGEEAPPEDPEAPKVEVFEPSKFAWTKTNGKPKTLPQLFRDYKGINCHPEEKQAESFNATSVREQIVRALDEFCKEVIKEDNTRNIYQQVIFKDDK